MSMYALDNALKSILPFATIHLILKISFKTNINSYQNELITAPPPHTQKNESQPKIRIKPLTHDATSWMRLVVCGVGSKRLVATIGDTRLWFNCVKITSHFKLHTIKIPWYDT